MSFQNSALALQDLASERLTQAKGVLSLLTANPDAPAFEVNMRDVMASLWAVEALIGQAHEAVQGISKAA